MVGQNNCQLLGIGLRLWHWAVFFLSNLPPSYICHISVSIQFCPINRCGLAKYVKRYEQRSANSIGTIYDPQLNPALTRLPIGEAGRNLQHK
jgi:hypothetical protein